MEAEGSARNGPGFSVQALDSGIGVASIDVAQDPIEILLDRSGNADEVNETAVSRVNDPAFKICSSDVDLLTVKSGRKEVF